MRTGSIKIIDIDSIELREKDIVVIKDWKDFCWLARNDLCVWKLKNYFYILAESVAYVYEDNHT